LLIDDDFWWKSPPHYHGATAVLGWHQKYSKNLLRNPALHQDCHRPGARPYLLGNYVIAVQFLVGHTLIYSQNDQEERMKCRLGGLSMPFPSFGTLLESNSLKIFFPCKKNIFFFQQKIYIFFSAKKGDIAASVAATSQGALTWKSRSLF